MTGGGWGQRRMPQGFGLRGSELGPLAAAKGLGRAYLKAVLQSLLGPPGLSALGEDPSHLEARPLDDYGGSDHGLRGPELAHRAAASPGRCGVVGGGGGESLVRQLG